ncbi:hypothetical protein KIPB_002768 [Kipferlia bialata]|uniref:Transmembrane protein n=1 Tax=Kipferlia bialata TaxID=797122 RepID=A0A9K3CSR8_9EUKA|nr:hypothetical protein KIPB_002768 [Kipferlia bialata]|eukprot:g2768.t1
MVVSRFSLLQKHTSSAIDGAVLRLHSCVLTCLSLVALPLMLCVSPFCAVPPAAYGLWAGLRGKSEVSDKHTSYASSMSTRLTLAVLMGGASVLCAILLIVALFSAWVRYASVWWGLVLLCVSLPCIEGWALLSVAQGLTLLDAPQTV